jgi:hypothetical protein
MIRKLLIYAALPACIAFQLATLPPAAFAQSIGGVAGVIRDSGTGQPLMGAQILAHNINSGANYSGVSETNGGLTIALPAGTYQITASKNGFARSSSTVKVTSGKMSQFDILLAPIPVSSVQLANELTAMKARIDQLESELKAKNAPEPELKVKTEQAPAPAKPEERPLLATATTDPSLMPRLPSAPAKEDELKTLAANTAALPPIPQQAAAPPDPPQAAAAGAPKDGVSLPDALQSPESTPGVDNFTFGAYGDFTWLNGTPRNKDTVLDTKFFTPEIRFDTHFMEDFNQPRDHTIVGATESFRSGEVQIEQISVGGDFHWQNVRGRVLYMAGLFATTTPRNDASFGTGTWDLRGAYKYTSEAWGGYHFNVNHGLNIDAGIFVSYIGLFSYYNFDNWTYQPSYVSSNTPWFFNGVRIQWFPTNKMKFEPWIINGWQSYSRYNGHLGLGGQFLWLPKEWFKLVANQYGFGQDNLGLPNTERLHTDDSIEVRYFNKPESTGISKMAFSLTGDMGIQHGGGICGICGSTAQKDVFLGWMAYDRIWFNKDKYAITLGGGQMSNPGRYLTLLPPINGADAVTGSPYFPQTPGLKAHMWDSTVTFHYMPRQYITWWAEVGYRHSDIPYFAGRGGVTPPGYPLGGTNGSPGQFACLSGAPSGASDFPTASVNCGDTGVWFPDLRRSEAKLSVGVLVKF